jgi:glutamyl-tRNA synthetase
LVLNTGGGRLAKRDGAVTLREIGLDRTLRLIADSLGYAGGTVEAMLAEFDPAGLPGEPWIFTPV